jgi:type II restriction enzyme
LIALPGVVRNLNSEQLLSRVGGEAIEAARLIDCVWFQNGRLMPAVMEIEHSTGVTSGLTRMQNFRNIFPPFPTRWVIVAPDEDRDDVITKCNLPLFKDMEAKFFPYSAVEELHALCQKRKVEGVTEKFLDCFMESAVAA